jgi:hypothetical protein
MYPNNIEHPASRAQLLIADLLFSFGKRYRAVPAEPMPSMAILTTINAKWWDKKTENSLVREISNNSEPHETRKTAR